ncbi:MAG TPA: discoidin domain-containing protein [Anaerolineaceae bacterium]|nr:discoidin domain-containing protein [Anaerolineaceae bacterium]
MVNLIEKLSLICGLLLVVPLLASCIGVAPTPEPLPLPTLTSTTLLPSSDVLPTITATPSIQPQAEHRIAIRQIDGQAEFYNKSSNQKFTPRGANYVYVPFNGTMTNLPLKVGIYDPQRTRDDFTKLASMGYNTVRVFLDACSSGPGCIATPEKSGLNPNYLNNIADMMIAAKEAGIYILFTSNDLPDNGGYSEEANQGSGGDFAGYRNSYYLRPQAISATRRYWRDLLNGLKERNAAFDSVLGWQLLNEQWMFRDQPPLSLTNGIVTTTTGSYNMSVSQQKEQMVSDGIIYYISQMKEEILTHDPTALVTMGFFVPELVAPGWYVETRSLLEKSELDFFDFHAYPGTLSLQAHVEAFGMLEYTAKPIILGEYGAFTHSYAELKPAARVLTNWVAESCQFGFVGWLFWAYYSASPSTGDRTWGMVDNDDYLLELFSPKNQNDPCVPVEVPSENLAYNKPINASRSLPEQPPEFAVDDVADTQWGSGADPQQWIEVDLENSYQINEIKLLVAQWPIGNTIHQVQVRQSSADSYITVQEFNGITKDNDWLIFVPDLHLENVRYIRIQTITSPSWFSWKEISVKGELAP